MYGDDHLFYEDFEVGQEWISPPREITSADIRVFADLSGDFNPIHLSAEYAATTPFGRPMAHGLLTLACASGMSITCPSVRTLALVELKSVKFLAAVYPGDVIHIVTRVVEKVRRGRGKRGQVTWMREVRNQDDKIVQEGLTVTLVQARDFPPPKESV